MAGKAPLLLAMVLFGVGAVGLGLTSAERASWGPFQPRSSPIPKTEVLVFDARGATPEPPPLHELTTPLASEEAAAAVAEEPAELYLALPEPTEAPVAPEPTPTPIPPLRVYGISSDDGGVSAAAATHTPPPIRIGGISFDP